MFEVLFGSAWTLFTAFMTFAWIGSEGKFLASDALGFRYKLMAIGGPMFILGIFWIIGLIILCIGLKKIIRNANTNKYGEECFGLVCDIYNSGAYINDVPELKSDVLVYIPSLNETKVMSEIIGIGQPQYVVGSYVRLKYYNDDINFDGIIAEHELPSAAKLMFEKAPKFNNKKDNTSAANGVEYNNYNDYDDYNEHNEYDDGPINYM